MPTVRNLQPTAYERAVPFRESGGASHLGEWDILKRRQYVAGESFRLWFRSLLTLPLRHGGMVLRIAATASLPGVAAVGGIGSRRTSSGKCCRSRNCERVQVFGANIR